MIKSYRLFSLETCTKCPAVEEALKTLRLKGEKVNASTGAGFEEARKHNVTSAPTVIFFDERGKEAGRAYTEEEVRRYADKGPAEDNPD